MSLDVAGAYVRVGVLDKECLSEPRFLLGFFVVICFSSKLLDRSEVALCFGRGTLVKNFTAFFLYNSDNTKFCAAYFGAYVFRPSFDEGNLHFFPCLIVDPELLEVRELGHDMSETFVRSCCFEAPPIKLESLECLV